eukprot:COSAG05_NODE_959_length_6425_cov_4.388397_1_plen_329_part_00
MAVKRGGSPPPPPPGGGRGPPPLPPGQHLLSAAAQGPQASEHMKGVNWNKLPMRKIGKSIWADAQEPLKMDYDLLGHLFKDYAKIKKEQEAAAGGAPEEKKKAVDDKVKFLDPKRAQNVSIVASSIKITPDALKAALLNADVETLTPEVVERLITLCPLSAEELRSCSEYTGDVEKLDRAERFLHGLAGLSGLEARLRCLHLQQHFAEWQGQCASSMAALTAAAEQVTASQELRLLLRYILTAGNYLNSGTLATHRKNARGVKLNFLLELHKTTTRGNPAIKKNFTFLHFMQNQVRIGLLWRRVILPHARTRHCSRSTRLMMDVSGRC